jgi:alkylhydroperoxidase/carboxymuconolactone decarboxylase family protein YurZ
MVNDPLKDAVRDTKRAAKDLAGATATLSKHLLRTATVAAKTPTASARRAATRVAKELDSAAKDIERILRDL